jgi:ABC-type multidrug transport system fused ATPase/permease subunit
MLNIILFTYRYFFVFSEDLRKMRIALNMRGAARRGFFRSMGSAANLAGSLLVRSYEQTERIYQAMMLRGYQGRIVTDEIFSLRFADVALAIILVLEPLAIMLAEQFGYLYRVDMIDVQNVTFSYDSGAPVLENQTLSVKKGEKGGIIGPNGAGKTTFFYLLCGILAPDRGEIWVNDNRIRSAEFNPETGFVFQNTDDQLFNISVFEDIAFGPVNMGLGRERVRQNVQKALEITGIAHLADRPPHHLSGGEKRMAAIASVIAMEPEL